MNGLLEGHAPSMTKVLSHDLFALAAVMLVSLAFDIELAAPRPSMIFMVVHVRTDLLYTIS